MAFLELNIFSESLETQQQVYVIVPQSGTKGEIGIENKGKNSKYKSLYLLHGLSDNHSSWLRRTSIERYAQESGICVIMPNAGRSFYTDMKFGGKYYTYIAKELPRIISEMLNVSDKREDRYIAGISMGGYGALKIGMKECDVFSAAAGLSSVADIHEGKTLFKRDKINIFGEEICIPVEEELFYLAEQCSDNANRPRIYMGVGTEDFLYPSNQKLRKKITSLKFDYTYRESQGAHSWEFWDEYIQYVIEWLCN